MKADHRKKLSSALARKDEITRRLREGRPAIFLDYDGTLTPIVDDPAQAILPQKTRQMLKTLSEHWTVVIISGRALNDVKALVGLESLIYTGSHGLNLADPEESFHERPGDPFLPALGRAEAVHPRGDPPGRDGRY